MWPFDRVKPNTKPVKLMFNLEDKRLDRPITVRQAIALIVFLFGYRGIETAVVNKSCNKDIPESIKFLFKEVKDE